MLRVFEGYSKLLRKYSHFDVLAFPYSLVKTLSFIHSKTTCWAQTVFRHRGVRGTLQWTRQPAGLTFYLGEQTICSSLVWGVLLQERRSRKASWRSWAFKNKTDPAKWRSGRKGTMKNQGLAWGVSGGKEASGVDIHTPGYGPRPGCLSGVWTPGKSRVFQTALLVL